ncbi:hypothetical protein D6D27_06124 [Aureobasidium pullulans]|nr:hypothetical protein D6D27_06124 [Aureobasidium pullulans]
MSDYHKPNRRKTTILDPIKDNTRLEVESQSVSPESEVEFLKALWSKQVDSPAEEPSSERQITDKAPSPPQDSRPQQQTAPKVIKTIHETAQPMPNCMLNIDNASFLEVWTSVVTQFLHPDLSWTTCLSVGNAIVTICTASDEYHHDPAQDNDHPSKGAAKNELEVMGFRLRLKCRLAVVDNQNRPADGAALESKFDSKDDYKTLKESLESSLQISHGGCKNILAEDAWTFYNELRPTVSQGPESWHKNSTSSIVNGRANQTIFGKRRAESPIPQPPAKRPVPVEPLRTSSQTHKQYAIAPEAAEDDSNIDYEATNAAFLELWSAVVAKHVYPELPWEACSNIGNAVLVLCMALGDGFFEDAVKQDAVCEPLYQPERKFDEQTKDKSDDRDENEIELVKEVQNDMKEWKEAAERKDINFMGFKLTLRDNLVFLSDTMTPINKQTTVDTKFESQNDLKSIPGTLKIFSPQTDNYWDTRLQVSWKRMGEVMMSYESLHQKVEQQVDPKAETGFEDDDEEEEEDSPIICGVVGDPEPPPHVDIMADNASLLELWAATVTRRVYHWLSWQTCLQIGNVVMVLCKASGDVFFELDQSRKVSETADKDEDESKVTSDEQRKLKLQSIEVNIMGFSLMLRNNSVFFKKEIISLRQPSCTFDREQDKDSMSKWYEYAINATFKNDTELLNLKGLDLFKLLLPPKRGGNEYWETRYRVRSSDMANTFGTLEEV